MSQSSLISWYDRLQNNLSFIKARTCHVSQSFLNLAECQSACIEHLWQNYMVARATVPLMENVVRVAKRNSNDPLSPLLISYMEKHIAEETDHDLWMIDDLLNFGITKDQILARPQTQNVAALIGAQYSWINHSHPVAFMGYLASLEIHHPSVEYVETLIQKSGLPREGFSTLMEHAIVDTHHKEDIIETLNKLPLTENQYQLIEMSAFHTFRYVALVMEDICNVAKLKCISYS